MNKFTIIPNSLKYKSSPENDQEISVSLEGQTLDLTEYDRSRVVSLSQVFYDERQRCVNFRPTFKLNYLYDNTYTGTTQYLPFQYNLYYVDPTESKSSGIWKGFPQFYEFDIYRPNVNDGHFNYVAKSSYTYNWGFYISHAYDNDYNKQLSSFLNNTSFNWTASDGIPFVIKNNKQNGNRVISFQCISPHNLKVGEYVELSFSYENQNLFQVYSLGNNSKDSDKYIFNIYNLGYSGNTFLDSVSGTFKRVINPENLDETRSKYYIKRHRILTNLDELNITKSGFERNIFKNNTKLEYSSITPNNITRTSKLTSSYVYNITTSKDINIQGVLDNQKRPISELSLTIINKGYSGLFNNSNGIKQGWGFNIDDDSSDWWDDSNTLSNTNIPVSSYSNTNGVTKTFYYNNDLKIGDLIDGDFCEWNEYEQKEVVVSTYYQKIKFNQDVFQTSLNVRNSPGYYYTPHNHLTIRSFSDYIETGSADEVDNIPNYAFYSSFDQEFRWRDLYDYGFIDDLGNGVDYPYFNSSHYPFGDINFRLIPEGSNFNKFLLGINVPDKPLFDDCE